MGICPICKLRFQIPFANVQTTTPRESTTPASSQTVVEQRLTKPTPPVSQKSTLSQAAPMPSNEQSPVNESRVTNKSITRQEDDQGQGAPNFSFNPLSDMVQTFLRFIIGIFKVIISIIIFAIMLAISAIPIIGIVIAAFLGIILFAAVWCSSENNASIKHGFWIGNSKEGKPDGYFTYRGYKLFYPKGGSVYKNDGCTRICNYYYSKYSKPFWRDVPDNRNRNVFYSKAPQTIFFFPKVTKILIVGDPMTSVSPLSIHRYTNPPHVCHLAFCRSGKITKQNGQIIAVYNGPSEGAAAAAAIFFKW